MNFQKITNIFIGSFYQKCNRLLYVNMTRNNKNASCLGFFLKFLTFLLEKKKIGFEMHAIFSYLKLICPILIEISYE